MDSSSLRPSSSRTAPRNDGFQHGTREKRSTAMGFRDSDARAEALKRVALVMPIVPFHGLDAFLDVGGLLANPAELQLALDLMSHEVEKFIDEIDAIGCFDARGFLFGPYLGAKFQKKVFMLRKPGKMPSVSHTIEYFKEYKGDNAATGGDELSIQHYAVKAGDRVLLVDDVLATGGTVEAGIRLVQRAGGVVVGVLVLAEVAAQRGRDRARAVAPGCKCVALLNETNF